MTPCIELLTLDDAASAILDHASSPSQFGYMHAASEQTNIGHRRAQRVASPSSQVLHNWYGSYRNDNAITTGLYYYPHHGGHTS